MTSPTVAPSTVVRCSTPGTRAASERGRMTAAIGLRPTIASTDQIGGSVVAIDDQLSPPSALPYS